MSDNPRVNVSDLMGQIRDQVKSRFERGDYPPDIASELEESIGGLSAVRMFERRLGALRATPFTADVEAASRKRIVGPVVAGAKRTVRGGLRWHTNALLGQVRTFQNRVVDALEVLGERVSDVEDTGERMLKELDGIRRSILDELQALRETAEDLKASMDERTHSHTERLGRVERAVREVRAGPPENSSPPISQPVSHSFEVERRFDYIGFEDAFRGDSESVAARQRPYMEQFRGVPGRVVDIGCGRGEFLELLRGEGIDGYGVDRHEDMVIACREKGLEIVQADAIEHLASLDEGSLGGIFAGQVVEHFEPKDVVRFFDLSASVLAEGGLLIVETVNPQSLYVFAHALYLDLGHDRPLHPHALTFLAERAGFRDVHVDYTSLPNDDVRPTSLPETIDPALRALTERIDENFKRIDAVLFGPQDYAVIARR